MNLTTIKLSRLHCIAALLIGVICCNVRICAAPSDISQNEITALQKDLADIGTQSSAAKKRRAYKSIVKKGNALIEGSPTAENRFQVLSIMFQGQKLLLGMDNTESSRKSLFEICAKLVKAPDTYASQRLEADLLLSYMKLDSKNADKEERVDALTALIERYRDTSGEARCLMIASQIARKIEAVELEKSIVDTMGERFPGDPSIINFRFKHLGLSRVEVPFFGVYKRADGASISFPMDNAGHASVVVFWSKKMTGYEEALKKINEELSSYSGLLRVFSFNADELPDAGEKQLRDLGLAWTAMHLPGGKNSRQFRIFGSEHPAGFLVAPYGHIQFLSPLAKYGRGHKPKPPELISEEMMPHVRYLAQLQSLFIGDFLVLGQNENATPVADSIPQATLNTIQECFIESPVRYRLTSEQALANYTKAEQLSREVIAQFPKAPDLWRVRNFRIIALLGMWNLAMEPKHLDAAAAEAHQALAANPPKRADVVAQFCLAKLALRNGEQKAESVLSKLIEATGGTEAPASAYAAATILALDANSKKLHAHYRQKLFESDRGDPMLWPVVTYLRDRYHLFHVLQPIDTYRERKISRRHIVNVSWNVSKTPFPNTELKTLEGNSFSLPEDTDGKPTLLLMVETPSDPSTEMPLEIVGKPAERKKRAVLGGIGYACKLADDHIHKDLNVVVAFLSDDTEQIRALVKKHAISCQVAMVPNGLKNPIVRQLGVLSADHFANVFLLRRDGTIAWQTSGLKHKSNFGHGFSVYLGMTVQVEMSEIAHAYKALAKGDYKKAVDLFAGPFPKKQDERFYWTAPRFHARALANMKLKQWDDALEDIDKALADHTPERFRHRHGEPCESMIEMLTVKAIILEKLGQKDEAAVIKKLASPEPTSYSVSIYEQFHIKLKKLRLKLSND